MKNTPTSEPEHEETEDTMSEKIKNIGFSYTEPQINLQELSELNVDRVCFRAKKAFEQIIFDTVKLEGNPYTFPEVKTLLDGVTVGGHKLSDEKQILNQAESLETAV